MKNIILEKKVESLELSNSLTNKLKNNNINIVINLWKMKRKELKQLGFLDNEISQIVIKLKLNDLDLNKKIY